jgi:CRP/FNR family cyclic AMP-dependent transcriptional regulator
MTLQLTGGRFGAAGGGPAVVSLLRADPDLAPGIHRDRRGEAQRRSAARLLRAEGPRLEGEGSRAGESGYGLFVLSGALCRRIVLGGRTAAELVGPGDLIRPAEPFAGWTSWPVECSWEVVRPARLAVLDRAFAERVAAFPEIPLGLNRRSIRRSARMATMLSTLCQTRVEDRLMALFCHLADRFGRTRSDCIHVPLPLTHSLLAELVAARRPSVTKALATLREEGSLRRDEEGWLLRGPGWVPLLEGG